MTFSRAISLCQIYWDCLRNVKNKPETNVGQIMKQRTHLLIPLLAISMLAVPVCKGAVVFSDDFSEAPGTAILGKASDVGGVWTQGSANGVTVSSLNSLDTAALSVQVFNTFTSTLGAGQIVTVQFDSLAPASGTFLPGNTSWGGISLYTAHTSGGNGNEVMFLGNPSAGFWGTDGNTTGRFFGTDTNEFSHVTFTYVYSTGAWTFSTSTGYTNSGTGVANRAVNGLRVGNGSAHPNFDNITVDISAVPVITFGAVSPANGAYSGSRTSVSLQATDGLNPVNTNTIVMKVDGGTVTPVITKSANVTTINYLPGSPLSAGALHTAQVTLADSGGTLYTNAWSFITAFQSLPSVLAGSIVVSNQNAGIVVFSTNDAWMGANYGASSGSTIYTCFSMEFDNLNGETGTGGGYGGLQFILGGINGAQHVIAGNAWASTNWSMDPFPAPQTDLNPVTGIVFGQWHTIVERVDLNPAGNATVSTWLDPDFTQTEAAQPNAPVVVSTVDTFDTVVLRTGNGTTSATFSNIVMSATSAGVGFVAPSAPQFQNLVPAANAPSASISTPIGAYLVFGTYGIGTNLVTLTLDGSPISPAFAVTPNSITVNYQPPTPFAASSSHTVALSVTDSNGTPYSISWSFTVDSYPTLPVSIAGPIDVSGGGAGVQIFGSTNGWIGGNYQSTSTNTLYTRFSMTFFDVNGEAADDVGGCFGGLHFYEGTTERLLTGETWLRNSWSIDDKAGGEGGELSLVSPPVVVVLGEWHTMVVKSVYSSNAATAETIWLDPDFTRSEVTQPQAPLIVSMDNTFDNIHLRCGNGSAFAEYTNIVIAATATGVGFAPAPPLMSLQGLNLSWTGAGTLQQARVVTGPWTDSGNQSNPQVIVTTNSAMFYRLRP